MSLCLEIFLNGYIIFQSMGACVIIDLTFLCIWIFKLFVSFDINNAEVNLLVC